MGSSQLWHTGLPPAFGEWTAAQVKLKFEVRTRLLTDELHCKPLVRVAREPRESMAWLSRITDTGLSVLSDPDSKEVVVE
jgi:hypothetical protein